MNKKNKNKNRSKPTTAAAPQKIEPPSVVEAVLPEENPTVPKENPTIVKESDSVIEVSEVRVPITEENNASSETPKKPKRNKGKKKKIDESELDESKTAPIHVPTDAPSEIEEKVESKAELKESKTEEGEKTVEESVTPNVRKKKNKKKQSEQVQAESKEEPKIETSPHEVIPAETLEKDVQKETVTEIATKPESSTLEVIDSIPSKKKNKKKKNRLDSEKSDKVDDIVSCTAAFEKLVASTDNESDIKQIGKDPAESVTTDKETVVPPKEETLKELIESVLLPESVQEPEKEQVKDEQSKSKKKNKKDKKQQQQKQAEQNLVADVQIIEQTSSLTASSETPQEIPKDDLDKDATSVKPVESEITDTKIKQKAKIAKPVEKPRKVKTESAEESKQSKDEVVAIELQKSQSTTDSGKAEFSEKNITSSDLTIDPKDIKSSEITIDQQTNENIDSITTDKPAEPLINIDVDIGASAVTEAPIADPAKTTDENTIKDITTTELTQPSDLTPSTIDKEITVELEEKDTPSVSEFKTVEKKKKKHPKKIDVASNVPTDKTPEYKVLTTPESESVKEDSAGKPTVESDFELSAADVEISSIKNDDKEGSSDVTPDFIHHPLASSQTLLDDNNNTFIREITSPDEKILPTLLTPNEPIIQGSGETPEPKFVPLILQRERSKTNELDEQKPEKTDLKSKMMEVSQDMEELRLSIERSLAELTSMERGEQEVEKEFEQTDAPRLGIVTESIGAAVDDKALEKSQIKTTTIEIGDTAITAEVSHETPSITEPIESKTQKIDTANNPVDIKIEDVKTPSPNPDNQKQDVEVKEAPPTAPARKDQKGKGKGRKKGKQEAQSQQTTTTESTSTSTTESTQEVKKEDKSEQKSQKSKSNENKGKQQATFDDDCNGSEDTSQDPPSASPFEPIENFEDALTSSVDDVNKTFEMIASEVSAPELFRNPEIKIIAPDETEAAQPKQNPVSPPKNLLGQPDIPVPSNRTDYKKERNKSPNMRQAKVKIKDAVEIDKTVKQSKQSQTDNKRKLSKNALESFSYMTNENAEYVYKYSFRKVFLQSLCHVCRKEMSQRVPCQYCSLVFYCTQKHKDEDWPQHQTLCFAVCTIVHLKDQKHIYADAKNITGHNYRLLRMQMIVACEKVLKRKLVPWEQEAFLYPRVCADVACREWKQSKLADCQGCGQISYCSEHPEHLPSSHQRWCRSYALYQKLVHHQQTKGRLEPKLPTRVMPEGYRIPEKITEVLASMFDEKIVRSRSKFPISSKPAVRNFVPINMTDMEYAALTQLATAPLTAAYSHQNVITNTNGMSKKSSLVVHIVGADLQFEADVLFKWEVFFLHLKPDVKELRVVLVGQDLNPSNLPLDLLGKVKLCESCVKNKRRVSFSFQDKKSYYEYWGSDEFYTPDIVCAFNQSIQRSSVYNGKDTWPSAISCILKLKVPFIISSYSSNELTRDLDRIKECSESCGVDFKVVSESRSNPFASVRPDRNFITDDEVPLLFKNFVVTVLCGV